MNAIEILTKAGVDTQNVLNFDVAGVTANVKEVADNFIFVAVNGVNVDGATFVDEAIAKGAKLILAERDLNTSIPCVVVDDARGALAKLASIIYPSYAVDKLAVTGTNGKTSTAYYVAQILNNLGILSANIGTIGVHSPVYDLPLSSTTPDTCLLNKILHTLEGKKVKAVVMETSSHGLHQKRVEGITYKVGGFTNLTQDHLDYHHTLDEYLDAKMNLFLHYMDTNGVAVLNADIPYYEKIKNVCLTQNLRILSYGQQGNELKLISFTPTSTGQTVELEVFNKRYHFNLDIFGDFQISNILCAIGMCYGYGADIEKIMAFLPNLKAPLGRMEAIGTYNNAPIFVDYAHTPDALERVLKSLRSHTTNKLVCVFGCGGNRDTTKRPIMGKVVNDNADIAYITDDNPRFEEAGPIRDMVKAGCPKGIVIGDRFDAIYHAISNLNEGDILVICGKGHETGQIINGISYILNDAAEVRVILNELQNPILYDSDELTSVFGVDVSPLIKATGVAINTQNMCTGDLFFAIGNDMQKAHEYARQSIEIGACACVVEHPLDDVPNTKQIVVKNTTQALEALARYARLKSDAKFVGITGSSGKTTTKEMLKSCLSGQGIVHATTGNLNNHLGVPVTLANLPKNADYALIEMGMNHAGELTYLSDLVRPDVCVITNISSAHREFFNTELDIAKAKAEIFTHMQENAIVVLNKDSEFYPFLSDSAHQNGAKKTISFGKDENATFHLLGTVTHEGKTHVDMQMQGEKYNYTLNFIGRHFALNSLAVLAVVDALGASIDYAMTAFNSIEPTQGRGQVLHLDFQNVKYVTVIDDAYNANPASMKASIETLGHYKVGRRIAILGDMLELGDESTAFHQNLAPVLIENKVDVVYCVGDLMGQLYDILPNAMQGAKTQKIEDMIAKCLQNIKTNDTLLIKSSNGMHLSLLVTALKGEAI